MPVTFADIEVRKSRTISLLFIVLLLMYFSTALIIYLSFKIFFFFPLVVQSGDLVTRMDLLRVFSVSAVLAALHFYFSAFGVARLLMERLGAVPPDPEDGVHKRFLNIMEEIHIASGNRRKITGLVIPTLSMNALAVADLRGEAAIAITEGLLSRLTRSQLEAVIAHEAYHILSGDCVEATVAVSLFGMYASALEKAGKFDEESSLVLQPVFWLFWLMLKLSELLSLLISREREFRADAGAVRMTRNPLALAEALQLLARNSSGSGVISTGIEMLCIADQREEESGEGGGWWSELVSTHPPLRMRIDILLGMAHAKFRRPSGSGLQPKVQATNTARWYYLAGDEQQWQGPFSADELELIPGFTPLSWVSTGPDQRSQRPRRASEIQELLQLFTGRQPRQGGIRSDFKCPLCRQYLQEVSYEQTMVRQCDFCSGLLVDNDRIPRIIARREEGCTERVQLLATAVIADNQRTLSSKKLLGSRGRPRSSHACPRCGNPMFRTFYSMAYLIEIDRCGICGLTWFDKDELEMLQCIIEKKITARLPVPSEE